MIEEGATYPKIIELLGPEGEGLNEVNLCNWKTGGYLDWLRARQLTEAIQAKYEIAQDIIANCHTGNEAGRAILHIVASNLCKFLADTDPATLIDSLLSDADKFTRFVNAMVRLAEGGIKCELHKFHSDDLTAEAAAKKNPAEAPGVSPESLHTAEQKLNLL